MNYNESITSIKGIGEKTAKLFQKLNLTRVGDLLDFYPRTYFEYPDALEAFPEDFESGTIAVLVRIQRKVYTKHSARMDVTSTQVVLGDVPISLVWFRMPYVKNQLEPGRLVILYGPCKKEHNGFKMEQAAIYTPEQYAALQTSLQPVYHLTKGLSNLTVKKSVKASMEEISLEDYIPDSFLKKHTLIDLAEAYQKIHFPTTMEELQDARRRLVYDEFFDFILRVQLEKAKEEEEVLPIDLPQRSLYDKVRWQLPFQLTAGQVECLEAMERDLLQGDCKQRLIQGDVGSGKTIVAFLAMLRMAENGYQTAIMAPTEVLAAQHYETFLEYCKTYHIPYPVYLLMGSMSAKEKKDVYGHLASDEVCFVIGTHALIQKKVSFSNLGMVITDEQHRFGVKQRMNLSVKGEHPYVLVMSATPIPRTLAMILYGDMQISTIRSAPKDRLPIKNAIIDEANRTKAYQFIAREIQAGHQAYIICPLIEASETTEAENVTEYAKRIEKLFAGQGKVGVLHGRMTPEEKNAVMHAFATNETNILVSTTVVEVGVNVPNATVMMIENANRFGLAQLHQLRGRVGRGSAQSYCMFIKDKSCKDAKRLEILNRSNDGFEIAAEDLKLRGPGDFYGIRQSGDMNFSIADIYQDADVLQMVSEDVADILRVDPELSSADGVLIRNHLKQKEHQIYDNL
ncbi:MAG: ATP-dependent DNA helicase RecG [Lachnospiraceae bacterium]|nr:ATP-dependent DNA helicase RecG [Lachnospiraceae bacterium]